MAYNYITKASYVALALLVVALFLVSPFYSDSFFAFMLNSPIKADPFLIRVLVGLIAAYFLVVTFHQITHKHPWPLAYIVFLSFLFSPFMVRNAFLLEDVAFLLALPFVVLSYIAYRYNYFELGVVFMLISLLDPRAAVAYIPILVMHFLKFRDSRSLLVLVGLLIYYFIASPLNVGFDPKMVGTILVFAALSLAFYEEVRPLAGFLAALPFLHNPYVIFPLMVVAIDIMHKITEKKFLHKHLAVSLVVFFLTVYILWGLPLQKVLGVALLTTLFFSALSYLTKDVGEYFYIVLFLTVLVEVALALALFAHLDLYGIELSTAKEVAQLDISHVIGTGYFYTYLTGKNLEPYSGGKGTVLIPLYSVYSLYPMRLDVDGEGLKYPFGRHTILFLPYGETYLDKAFTGVVVYDSPTAVVVKH